MGSITVKEHSQKDTGNYGDELRSVVVLEISHKNPLETLMGKELFLIKKSRYGDEGRKIIIDDLKDI